MNVGPIARVGLWAQVLLVGAGCAVATSDEGAASEPVAVERVAEVSSADSIANGRSINGRSINGRNINGRNINGRNINGRNINGRSLDGLGIAYASTDGASIDGVALQRIELDGTWLKARDARGRKHKKKDFEGADLAGVLDDGTPIPLRIDAIHAHEGPGGGDVHAYEVSFRTDEGWDSFCGTDAAGAPVRAVPLLGRWDYREGVAGGGAHARDPGAITFACEGFVLAKCVGAGYRPWAEARGVSLAPYHEACTRLLRADYCGDGTPHTQDGVTINIYDALGLQRDTERWSLEAEWTPSGASCVAHSREGALPTCAASRVTRDCGSRWHFLSGQALLMSEDRVARR